MSGGGGRAVDEPWLRSAQFQIERHNFGDVRHIEQGDYLAVFIYKFHDTATGMMFIVLEHFNDGSHIARA